MINYIPLLVLRVMIILLFVKTYVVYTLGHFPKITLIILNDYFNHTCLLHQSDSPMIIAFTWPLMLLNCYAFIVFPTIDFWKIVKLIRDCEKTQKNRYAVYGDPVLPKYIGYYIIYGFTFN